MKDYMELARCGLISDEEAYLELINLCDSDEYDIDDKEMVEDHKRLLNRFASILAYKHLKEHGYLE